jgi:hypothetical protein
MKNDADEKKGRKFKYIYIYLLSTLDLMGSAFSTKEQEIINFIYF